MTNKLTATQARTLSTSDKVIYNEIDTISRAIIDAALLGDLSTVVDDGTTITESTPVVTVTSSGYSDGWTPGATLAIAGETVTLSSGPNDGTNIDQATADINNAGISGLTATNDGSEITLSYQAPQSSWTLALSEGSGGLNELGFTAGTTTLSTNPESVDYYNVWSGTTGDRKKSYEIEQVLNHFQSLGYNVVIKKNVTSDTSTIKWELYW